MYVMNFCAFFWLKLQVSQNRISMVLFPGLSVWFWLSDTSVNEFCARGKLNDVHTLILADSHTLAGEYAIQHHTKSCSPENMLASTSECIRAKTVLDPDVDTVGNENYNGAPKGCSRFEGKWFFNTHKTGALDGTSEPVCKASTGKPWRLRNLHTRTSFSAVV